MARETDGELVCNLGFDCPSESHYKDNLAGIKLSFLRRSQWLLSPSDFLRNWKADQYGICGQLCWQNGLFRLAQERLPSWANWARQLHSNAEANRTLLAGEIARDSPPHTATISPLIAAFSASAFDPANQGRRHHDPALQRSTQKADNFLRIAGVNDQG